MNVKNTITIIVIVIIIIILLISYLWPRNNILESWDKLAK